MLSLAEKGVSDPGVSVPSGMSILGTPLGAGSAAEGMLGGGFSGEFSRTGRPIVLVEVAGGRRHNVVRG